MVRRETDLVARYGGEEFAIILPYTDFAGAGALAENLRSTVERELGFEWAGHAVTVTVSVGAATAPGGAIVEPDDLVAAADEALYASKQAGRNCVTVRPPGDLRQGRPAPVTP